MGRRPPRVCPIRAAAAEPPPTRPTSCPPFRARRSSARLANEEAQRNAMIALLAKAQSVSDIIAVQNQLGQITGQIEQLKGQIQYIDHNVAFSTITVQITEAGAPVTTAPSDNWGFVSALSDAAHNFVTTINYLI